MSESPAFDWLTLDEDEEVVWADTPHRLSLVPAFVVGVPLSLVLVGIPIVVGAYLSHRNTNYVVTTTALYRKTGVLSRDVQRIEFDKVQNTSYRQSALGSSLGYGTVDISTAGGSGIEMRFSSVAEPQHVQTLINERIRGRRGRTGDDPGVEGARDKAAVLDDILTELRAIRAAVEESSDEPDTRTDGNLADASSRGSVDATRAPEAPGGDPADRASDRDDR